MPGVEASGLTDRQWSLLINIARGSYSECPVPFDRRDLADLVALERRGLAVGTRLAGQLRAVRLTDDGRRAVGPAVNY